MTKAECLQKLHKFLEDSRKDYKQTKETKYWYEEEAYLRAIHFVEQITIIKERN